MAGFKLSKDVSVGEYDIVTGLTYITHQRGRLLFNMGASTKKQPRREPDASSVAAKRTPPTFLTGMFTGLSLYPEEAHYLLQREALVIYRMTSKDEDAREFSVADFTALLARDTRVSLACLEVYSFLKDQKLHPRRCLKRLTESAGSEDGRSVPHHIKEVESCDVAFDVWKTVAVDVSPPEGDIVEQATELSVVAATDKGKKLKQRKKLMLVFRVAVYRYWDAAPSPRSFRQVISRSKARDCGSSGCSASLTCDQVPVKIAVVHHDQSVLIFEINSA